MADPAAATPPAPIRRIVTGDDDAGRGVTFSDGPATDVRGDPGRPGYSSARIWVTDSTPARARGLTESVHLPHTLEPPPGGSVFRIVTFPPDANWRGNVTGREVSAFFMAMGSPSASTYGPRAPHPYMHKTGSLDFCVVLDGDITLVLDTEEVQLAAGDVVVQHGTNHAWSNRSDRPCTVAFTLHDGKEAR